MPPQSPPPAVPQPPAATPLPHRARESCPGRRPPQAAAANRPDHLDPLVWCYLLHYQLECIHPFGDGNGRVGPLLLCLMIADRFRLGRPWLYMSPWFDRYKDEYIDRMFRISTRGDWRAWVEFCLRGTVQQCRDTLQRLDHLFDVYPVVRVASTARRLDVSYPTAKSDIDALVRLGILEELQDQRPKAFYAPAILRAGTVA